MAQPYVDFERAVADNKDAYVKSLVEILPNYFEKQFILQQQANEYVQILSTWLEGKENNDASKISNGYINVIQVNISNFYTSPCMDDSHFAAKYTRYTQ